MLLKHTNTSCRAKKFHLCANIHPLADLREEAIWPWPHTLSRCIFEKNPNDSASILLKYFGFQTLFYQLLEQIIARYGNNRLKIMSPLKRMFWRLSDIKAENVKKNEASLGVRHTCITRLQKVVHIRLSCIIFLYLVSIVQKRQ